MDDVHHAKVTTDAWSGPTNVVYLAPTQNVMAGVGGKGGNYDKATGGSVKLDLTHTDNTTEYAKLNDVLNNSHDFHVSDLVHV